MELLAAPNIHLMYGIRGTYLSSETTRMLNTSCEGIQGYLSSLWIIMHRTKDINTITDWKSYVDNMKDFLASLGL